MKSIYRILLLFGRLVEDMRPCLGDSRVVAMGAQEFTSCNNRGNRNHYFLSNRNLVPQTILSSFLKEIVSI